VGYVEDIIVKTLIMTREVHAQLTGVEYATFLSRFATHAQGAIPVNELPYLSYHAGDKGLYVEVPYHETTHNALISWSVGYMAALGFDQDGVRHALTMPTAADLPHVADYLTPVR
jgi:hypothetical protein